MAGLAPEAAGRTIRAAGVVAHIRETAIAGEAGVTLIDGVAVVDAKKITDGVA